MDACVDADWWGGVYKEYRRNEYVQKNAKLVRTWRLLLGYPDSNQE